MQVQKFDYINYVHSLSQLYKLEPLKLIRIISNADVARMRLTKNIQVGNNQYSVTKLGIGPLITKQGKFYQVTFMLNDEWHKYLVIVKSEFNSELMIPKFDTEAESFIRIDSGCTTGQIFNDLTCDCKQQLEIAMAKLSENKQGVIISIPTQDGRGKGIDFKLATLYLQEQIGVNTIEAFTLLERNNAIENIDCRTYEGAIAILKFLEVGIKLTIGTNNPQKIKTLQENGFIVGVHSVTVEPTEFTARHLEAKQKLVSSIQNEDRNESSPQQN
jgi:GTP cyclohydrolase II